MNDLVNIDNDSGGSPSNLTQKGVAAVGFLAAGAGFLVMGALPFIVGVAVGGLACFIGAGSVFSRDKTDRTGGLVLFAGGALTLLAKFRLLAALSRTALAIGAVACIGLGIWNGIKFLRGLKARR
jgi:hypothetical protein